MEAYGWDDINPDLVSNYINIKIWTCDSSIKLPEYATVGSAGFDLRVYDVFNPDSKSNSEKKEYPLSPGEHHLFRTGIHIEIPKGYELQIRPKSGLALNHGISIVNSPGTIDSDYRGEIGIILINHSQSTFTVNNGDKIAQGIIAPVYQAMWMQVEKLEHLNETKRQAGGFGSTGQ